MTVIEDRDGNVQDPTLFGDEIDLRQVLQVFVNHWPWVVLTTLVAMLVAAGFSFFVASPSYEATALVAITPPKYVMQLSPGFEAVAEERIQTEIYGTYPELAKSDELLQEVVAAVNADSSAALQLAGLRNIVSVQGSKDVGLIYLRATHQNRELAATIVNTWAERYVSMLNRLYGGETGDYEFFVEQLAQAKDDLDVAQDALVEFKARDLSTVLQSKLLAADEALAAHLGRQYLNGVLLQDVQGWRQQLVSQAQGDGLSLADELTAVLLQLKAFDVLVGEPQLQVAIGQLGEGSHVADQLASLSNLEEWLQARLAELDARIGDLQPEILGLQEAYQEAKNEGERLTQQVEIATSVYQSLALKAEEARIARESQAGVGRLASRAAVPTRPTGPRKLFNTAVGAGLGLLTGLAIAVFLEAAGRRRRPALPESTGDGG